MFRWFPELSTSYSRLNYGNHVPLPHFKDNRPIKNSHLITIKSSQPGSNFAERYYQTLDRAIKPLLSQVPVRQRNGIKFIDKENDSKIKSNASQKDIEKHFGIHRSGVTCHYQTAGLVGKSCRRTWQFYIFLECVFLYTDVISCYITCGQHF